MKQKTRDRIVFWTRMTGWLATGCAAPVAVFATKFGLFNKSGYTVTTDELGNITDVTVTAFNGWGIVSVILVICTLVSILKEIRNAYTGYSLTKQCLDNFISSIMPLIIAFAVCYFLNGVLEEAMFCLGTIIICKTISIPLNPLPKWRYETKGVEDYSDALTFIAKTVKSKLGKGGDK